MPRRQTVLLTSLIVATGILCLSLANVKPVTVEDSYSPEPALAELFVKVAHAKEQQVKVNASLDPWLDALMLKESGGRSTFDGLPYIIDTNGKRSYSCFMFQEATFAAYSKRYGITGSIEDCQTQRRVAKAMIQENRNNWRHWYNSVMTYKGRPGIGLPPLL